MLFDQLIRIFHIHRHDLWYTFKFFFFFFFFRFFSLSTRTAVALNRLHDWTCWPWFSLIAWHNDIFFFVLLFKWFLCIVYGSCFQLSPKTFGDAGFMIINNVTDDWTFIVIFDKLSNTEIVVYESQPIYLRNRFQYIVGHAFPNLDTFVIHTC